MATNKTKPKSTKSNAKKPQSKNKKYNNYNKNNKNNNKRNEVDLEVYAIGLIAVSFVLFISVYISSNFIITSFIKSVFVGLFGICAYIIPFVIFTLGSLMFLKQEKLETKKYIYIGISLLIMSAFFQTVTNTDLYNAPNDTNFVTKAYTSATYYNGGLVGALFSNLFVKLFGKILTTLILLFSFIYLQILLFNYSFNDIIIIVKNKIENIKFQNEFDDDYIDDDIDVKNDTKNLNIEKEIVFSSDEIDVENKNTKKKNIQNDEINGKRAFENVDNRDEFNKRSNELNSKNVRYKPKPEPTINVKKKSVFSKKPKVRIFDFSTIYGDKKSSVDPLESMEREEMLEKFDVGDGVFVNVKKNKREHLNENYQQNYQNNYQYQNYQQNYQEQNYQDNYQDQNYQQNYQDNYQDQNYNYSQNDQYNINHEYIEPNQNDLNYQKELDQKDAVIKSLKEELDRQMFLFQDSQLEFIEQKKLEKSLLKIINAQRDTIDKLVTENKAYENIHANIVKSKEIPKEEVKATTTEPIVEVSTQTTEPIVEVSAQTSDDTNENVLSFEPEIQKVDDIINSSEIKVSYDGIDNIIDTSSDDIDTTEPYNSTVATEYVEIINDTSNNEINEDVEKMLSEEDILNLSLAKIKSEILNNEKDIQNTGQNIIEPYKVEPYKVEPEIIEVSNDSYEIEPPKVQSIFDPKPTYSKPIEPVSEPVKYEYKYPTVDFLVEKPVGSKEQHSKTELLANSKKLEMTLKSFGVVAKVLEVSRGPSVTRYEVQPGLGVKVSKIANLSDDLALNLSAKSIRIQAPIPGKPAVGIEVPNETTEMVYLREVLDDENFRNFNSKLAFGIGKDIAGKIVVADLATMPHLLIAGATGSGKSVCVNTLITSIIYKSSPDEVKLLMVDPKVVELSVYNGIPHLLIPVVTDPKKASAALNWAVREMEKRYKLFSDKNVRDLKGYNRVMAEEGGMLEPQIVIIIDELADLMMTAAKEVEAAIIRLAQMARAAGIHLIIATQRPSVDVITGIIKANIPSRLAFAVSSGIDSKTILDTTGAEKLLGKGDMLFSPMGSPEPIRIQGAFISDKEVESIVDFLKTDTDHEHMKEIIEEITSTSNPNSNLSSSIDTVDEILEEVVDYILTQEKVSVSATQRKFRIGFNRASRIFEELESFGVVSSEEGGNKPRRVLMTREEWDNKFKT